MIFDILGWIGMILVLLAYALLSTNKIENGKVSCGEIGIPVKKNDIILPCGIYGRWEAK